MNTIDFTELPLGTKVRCDALGAGEIFDLDKDKYNLLTVCVKFHTTIAYFTAEGNFTERNTKERWMLKLIEEPMKEARFPDFSQSGVGDKVWDLQCGDGVIKSNNVNKTFAIIIEFPNGDMRSYMKDGRLYSRHAYPSLFHQAFTVPDIAFKKPIKQYPIDTKVIVWDRTNVGKLKRHLHHIDEYGKAVCFDAGTTSHSCGGSPHLLTWQNYEVIE